MILTIFGATGMVGKQLVEQALFRGHTVKAFGRNVFSELPMEEDNLQLIKGALFDEKDVLGAIKGSDAVLSSLGGDFGGEDKTRSLGMKNIVAQMEKTGVNRIVAIGGLGVLQADENTLVIDEEDYPKEYIPVGLEHKKAWEYLLNSHLDWTFVCPTNIIEGKPTGKITTATNYLPNPNKYQISAGNLALFMLSELERNEFIKQRVGISN
ncbi:MAG: SDR family oxidoreductase [Ferruginibacter sp.]|nr:SDR family oxidoreductase [Ferruginibacter sp.]